MQVQTTRFGILEIKEDLIIHFPNGIPGFESLRRFFFIPVEGTENLNWLHAADDPAVALLVIDPFKYLKDYACDVPETDILELEIENQEETLLLATVTIPRANPTEATANLVAPIVINTRLKKARQVILVDALYTTRHRLFPTAKQLNPTHEENKPTTGTGRG
ncbi:MAG TPA: flagellar assembly protein FliW [Desulfotomaculum sp.]|nr:MAG: flagellar assembly protein FliW [Desulfotomaculum sp. BICA1-6]HBX23717.1 flagellar assembly protein FliW [Desulfotomaculum sp.]